MTKKEFRKRVCKDIVDGKHEGIEDALFSLADVGCYGVEYCDAVTLLAVIAYLTDCGFKISNDRYCYDRNMCTMSTHKRYDSGKDYIHFSMKFDWEKEVNA